MTAQDKQAAMMQRRIDREHRYNATMQHHTMRQTDRNGKTSNSPTGLYTADQRTALAAAKQADRTRHAQWMTWQTYTRNSAYLTSAQRTRLTQWRKDRQQRLAGGKRTRRTLHYLTVSMPDQTHGTMTDTAAHYINHAARVMAYTALRTQWINSGHPYVYRLMLSAWADTRRQGYNDTRRQIEQQTDADGNAMTCQIAKVQKRTKVAGIYVPCYNISAETTAAGQDYINADIADVCAATDYDDCVSVAVLTLLEHANAMICYADVWQLRTLVYRAVNRYVHSQRASRAQMDNFAKYCIKTDADGNETVVTGAIIDRDITALLDADGRRAICDYVRDNCRQRNAQIQADEVADTLRLTMDGLTTRTIADLKGRHNRQIDKWLRQSRMSLDTAEGRTFIASILFA